MAGRWLDIMWLHWQGGSSVRFGLERGEVFGILGAIPGRESIEDARRNRSGGCESNMDLSVPTNHTEECTRHHSILTASGHLRRRLGLTGVQPVDRHGTHKTHKTHTRLA